MNGGRADNLLLGVKHPFAVEAASAQHDRDVQSFRMTLVVPDVILWTDAMSQEE